MLLVGKTIYQLDEVNRLRLPPKQREAFGDEFYISVDRRGALLVRTKAEMEKINQKLAEVSMGTEDKQDAITEYYAHTSVLSLDSQGRFLLPQGLKDCVLIKKNVVVIGHPRGFLIWSEEVYNDPQAYAGRFDKFDKILQCLGECGV